MAIVRSVLPLSAIMCCLLWDACIDVLDTGMAVAFAVPSFLDPNVTESGLQEGFFARQREGGWRAAGKQSELPGQMVTVAQ
jgi:hypothetical protein